MSPDYLKNYVHGIEYDSVQQIRNERQLWLNRQSNFAFKEALHLIPAFQSNHIVLNETVSIGKKDELSPEQHQHLHEILNTYIPWRKGPFEVFGTQIDAEWKSDLYAGWMGKFFAST